MLTQQPLGHIFIVNLEDNSSSMTVFNFVTLFAYVSIKLMYNLSRYLPLSIHFINDKLFF